MQGLGIAESLTKFLDTAVDITEVKVDFLMVSPVDCCAESKYAVVAGCCWTDVDNEVLGCEDHVFTILHDSSVGFLNVGNRSILYLFMVKTHGIHLRIRIVVLAQGVTYPVVAQEQSAHIGVIDEDYAEVIINFTLIEIGHGPKVGYAVKHGLLTVGS